MRRCPFWLALMLAVGLGLHAGAAGPKKEARKPDPKEARDKLIATGALVGRVTEVDGSARTFTLQVTLLIPIPNEDAIARQVELRQELVQALTIPDPSERLQQVQQVRAEMLENQASLVTIEERQEDIALETADDVKVRGLKLPPVYDDKGRLRKYTAKELRELKGPGRLPGYQAGFADVETEQFVQVVLSRKKAPPAKGEAPKLLVTAVLILGRPE